MAKTISKKTREQVYNKYYGHCAYCGKEIQYKDMQLDHLIPRQRERFKKYTEEDILSNLDIVSGSAPFLLILFKF